MSGELNWADWVIVGILLLSAVVSLMRGLVVEVASLAIAIFGALLAFHFASAAADQFLQGVEIVPLRTGIAALAIYILTSVVGAMALYLLKRLIRGAGLSGTDRMLGLVFGFARGMLIVVALFWVATLMRLDQSDWWPRSQLLPGVARASDALLLFLPANVREMIAHPERFVPALPDPAQVTPQGLRPASQAIGESVDPAAAEAAAADDRDQGG